MRIIASELDRDKASALPLWKMIQRGIRTSLRIRFPALLPAWEGPILLFFIVLEIPAVGSSTALVRLIPMTCRFMLTFLLVFLDRMLKAIRRHVIPLPRSLSRNRRPECIHVQALDSLVRTSERSFDPEKY
jgi:hypothetical protein